MGHISNHIGHPRKPHQCRVCGDEIPAKAECMIYRGVENGVGFYTSYFHLLCWDYSRDWEDYEWESISPGCVSREEMRREVGLPEDEMDEASDDEARAIAAHIVELHNEWLERQ